MHLSPTDPGNRESDTKGDCMKRIFRMALGVALVGLAASCTTVTYFGPSDIMGSASTDQFKTAQQKSALNMQMNLVSTFDEEYTRDAKGNVLKYKQTQYFNVNSKDKQFYVWETEYQDVGGRILPSRLSINGVPYVEVTWQVLGTKAQGAVVQDIPHRYFARYMEDSFWGISDFSNWYVNLDAYGVGFNADDKFVVTKKTYNEYGPVSNNYLTLGYDNVVIKSFSYSYEKLSEGMGKSILNYYVRSRMLQRFQGYSVKFEYAWDTIAGKNCQTSQKYHANIDDKNIDFTASLSYNEQGLRTKEEWTLLTEGKNAKPVVIFSQELQY